jgi:hypothetical protein
MSGTQRSILISTELRQIAEQAIEHPDRVFTSLIHRMDFDFLREAFYELRRDGAPGLSGITVKDYEKDLEANLRDLHERLRTQAYEAPPIKRVWFEKDNGKKRPIGITERVGSPARCWRTSSSTMRSTNGWKGSIPVCRLKGTQTMRCATARARLRPWR